MDKRFTTKIFEVETSPDLKNAPCVERCIDVKLIPSCQRDTLGSFEVNTYWVNWCHRHLPNGRYRVVTSLTRSPYKVTQLINIQ